VRICLPLPGQGAGHRSCRARASGCFRRRLAAPPAPPAPAPTALLQLPASVDRVNITATPADALTGCGWWSCGPWPRCCKSSLAEPVHRHHPCRPLPALLAGFLMLQRQRPAAPRLPKFHVDFTQQTERKNRNPVRAGSFSLALLPSKQPVVGSNPTGGVELTAGTQH